MFNSARFDSSLRAAGTNLCLDLVSRGSGYEGPETRHKTEILWSLFRLHMFF